MSFKRNVVLNNVEYSISSLEKDPKSKLKEIMDATYSHHYISDEDFVNSLWIYIITVWIHTDKFVGHGASPRKKDSEKFACQDILNQYVRKNDGETVSVLPQMDLAGFAVDSVLREGRTFINSNLAGVPEPAVSEQQHETGGQSEPVTNKITQDPTIGGEVTNVGQESVNTIITTDSTVQSNMIDSPSGVDEDTIGASSTEPVKDFTNFFERWVNLETLVFSNESAPGLNLYQHSNPSYNVQTTQCNSNLSPLESFAFCEPIVEYQFAANGVRMYAGKLISTYLPDAVGLNTDNYRSAYLHYAFPHIELDLDAHNTGILTIPHVFPRTFLQIHPYASGTGVVVFDNAAVYVTLVDVLRVGAGQAGTVRVNMKYRFKRCKFAAIASRLPITTFGDNSASVVPQMNTDKVGVTQVYNSTRMDFSSSDGPTVVQELRLHPRKVTSFRTGLMQQQDPVTVYDVTRQWGFVNKFTWSSSKDADELLFESRVEPSRFFRTDATDTLTEVVSPIEFMSAGFTYWRGPIEFMFKCVSSQFHTGELMVSASYGRNDPQVVCQAKSSYNKYFVLGSQKTFNFVAPFIHDNPWKRTHSLVAHSSFSTFEVGEPSWGIWYNSWARNTINEFNPVRLRVHVVTPLNFISNVADEITILVFARAAPGFDLSVPCMSLYQGVRYVPPPNTALENYPFAFGPGDHTPGGYSVTPQINTGETEVADITPNFSLSTSNAFSNVTEDFNNLYSLCKRPINFLDVEIPHASNIDSYMDNGRAYWIPVTPNISRLRYLEGFNAHSLYTQQQNIFSMYRHWRGALKYVFEFYLTSGDLVDWSDMIVIQHLPHTGIENMGSQIMYNVYTFGAAGFEQSVNVNLPNAAPLCEVGVGLGEIHVRPQVQPTVTVAVPYYTENNFTRMGLEIAKETIPMRDAGSFNAGHLRIFVMGSVPNVKTRMRVYLSIADDFKLRGYFFGPPRSIRLNLPGHTIADDHDTASARVVVPHNCNSQDVYPQMDESDFKIFSQEVREAMMLRSHYSVASHEACVKVRDVYKVYAKEVNYDISLPSIRTLIHTKKAKRIHDELVKMYNSGREVFSPDFCNDASVSSFGRLTGAVAGITTSIANAATEVVKTVCTPKNAILGTAAAVAPGIAIAYAGARVERVLHNVEQNVATTSKSIQEAAEDTSAQVSMLSAKTNASIQRVTNLASDVAHATNDTLSTTTRMLNGLYDQLTGILTPIANIFTGIVDLSTDLVDFFFDFCNLLLNMNYKTFALTICKFLFKFKIFSREVLFKLSSTIQEYAKYLFSRNEAVTPQIDITVHSDVVSREDNQFYSTICGLLVGVITSMVGVALKPSATTFASFSLNLASSISSPGFWSIARNATLVFQNLMSTIQRVYQWVLRKVDGTVDYALIFREQSGKIVEFVQKAQEFSLAYNKDTIVTRPALKRELFALVLQAMQIRTTITVIENRELIKNTSGLLKICDNLIKMFNEVSGVLACSPVRYEPFVICIAGRPGIGKSYVCNHLIPQLLHGVGIKHHSADMIYVRNGASQFWDGYTGQPVVLYDDWMCIKDPQTRVGELDEMFKLKSSANFTPNQANLMDKDKRINPMIVVYLTNNAFPDLSNLVTTQTAIYRRRDALITMHSNGKIEPGNEEFPHASFTWHASGTTRQGQPELYSYLEIKKKLMTRYSIYHEQEKKNVSLRLSALYRAMGEDNPNAITDPFTTLHQYEMAVSTVTQSGFLPTDILAFTIDRLIHQQADSEVEEDTADPEMFSNHVPSITAIGAKLAKKCLSTAYDSIVSYGNAARGCVVCMDDDVLTSFRCTNSTTLNPHSMCASCFTSLTVRICPICRNAHIEQVPLTTVEPWLLKKIKEYTGYNYVRNKYDSTTIEVRYIVNELLSLISNMLSVVFWLGYAARFNNPFCAIFTAIEGISSMYRLMVSILNIEAAIPQVDPVDVELPSDIYFCADYIPNTLIPETPPVCYHHACTILNASSSAFSYFVGKNEIVVKYPITYTVPGCTTEYVLAEGSVVDLRFCDKTTCPFIHAHNVANFVKSVIKNDPIVFKISLKNALANPTSHVAPFLVPQTITPVQAALLAEQVQQSIQFVTDINVKPWYIYILDFVSEWWKTIIVGIGVVTASVFAFNNWLSISSFISDMFLADSTPQVNYSGASQPVRILRTAHTISSARAQIDDLGRVVERKIIQNSFIIKFHFQDRIVECRGVGILAKYAVIPQHYIRFVEYELNEKKNILHMTEYVPCVDMCNTRVIVWDSIEKDLGFNTDLAVLTMTNDIPMFANIVKYMPSCEGLNEGAIRNSLTFLSVNPGKTVAYSIKLKGIKDCNYRLTEYWKDMIVRDCLFYNYQNVGECGSFIVQEDPNVPILAMHVAGASEGGYGVFLTRDSFEHLLVVKPKERCSHAISRLLPVEKSKVWFSDQCQIDYLGCVEPEMEPYIPKNSKIVPSLIQGIVKLPLMHAPAILSTSDPRHTIGFKSPLIAGCEKHGKLTNNFPPRVVNIARSWLESFLVQRVKPIRGDTGRLTYKQAIVGFPNLEHYDPLDLSTSAGWPYNRVPQMNSKKAWIEAIRDEQEMMVDCNIHERVLCVMEHNEKLRQEGTIPFTVFEDHLKDETLHIEKVLQEGKTRVFCMSPTDFTIQARRDYLDFTAAFTKARFNAFHAIGMAVDGPEWGKLYHMLLDKSRRIMCMDYKNFGPGLNAELAMVAHECIDYWYKCYYPSDKEGSQARRSMAYELSNSLHITINLVYAQMGGSPSGAPQTTYKNTLVNLLYLMCVYILLCLELDLVEEMSLKKFIENVYACLYGDDMIVAVKEGQTWFNMKSIQKMFAKYGIIVTGADKGEGEMVEYLDITDADFLKRSFRIFNGRILAPLNIDSIYSCCQFVRKIPNMEQATLVNAEAAIRLAYAHGPAVFGRLKFLINAALMEIGLDPISLSWEEIDAVFFP